MQPKVRGVSRNSADALQMIRRLEQQGPDPQAIEQPPDRDVPENPLIIGF